MEDDLVLNPRYPYLLCIRIGTCYLPPVSKCIAQTKQRLLFSQYTYGTTFKSWGCIANNEHVKKIIWMLMALAFVPFIAVHIAFTRLIQKRINNVVPTLQDLIQYYSDTWLRLAISHLHHQCETCLMPTSGQSTESWHRRLNHDTGKYYPNIHILARKEQVFTEQTITQSGSGMPQPSRTIPSTGWMLGTLSLPIQG